MPNQFKPAEEGVMENIDVKLYVYCSCHYTLGHDTIIILQFKYSIYIIFYMLCRNTISRNTIDK